MNGRPQLAELTPELHELREHWRSLDRGGQDRLFAEELGPELARLFAGLALHGAPEDLVRPLLAWYLAAASRLATAEKPSLALLLTHAAVERYIDLCLWFDFGLDDERPYSLIEDRLDPKALHRAGREIFGKNYQPRPPEGPLMFGNGAQLLAALSPERLPLQMLGPLRGLSADRNKCEYEHGLSPRVPSAETTQRHLEAARRVIALAFGEVLEAVVHAHRVPMLSGPEPQGSR